CTIHRKLSRFPGRWRPTVVVARPLALPNQLNLKNITGYKPSRFSMGGGISMSRSWMLLIFNALLLASRAAAQVDTGTISGTVRDQTGAVVQGAIVKVENQDTGISVSTITN